MIQRRRLILISLLVGESAWAAADSRDPAAAEELFQQARRLMDSGQDPAACPKLEESQRLDPGVGTLMYLALCYERIGRTASAWSTYRVAASAARNAGQLERQSIASSRAEALEPQLSRIVLRVPIQHTPGLVLARDGIALGQAAWNLGVPVDPGTHQITASAPNYQPYSVSVEVPANGAETVFDVPMLKPVVKTGPEIRGVVATQHRSRPSSAAADAPTDGTGNGLGPQRWAAIGVGALGVAGLGLGTYFALRSRSLDHEANQYRTPGTDVYDDRGFDLNQRALDHRDWARWSFVAGGVAIAAGATLFLVAPGSNGNASTALRIRATSSASVAALTVEGGWQ